MVLFMDAMGKDLKSFVKWVIVMNANEGNHASLGMNKGQRGNQVSRVIQEQLEFLSHGRVRLQPHRNLLKRIGRTIIPLKGFLTFGMEILGRYSHRTELKENRERQERALWGYTTAMFLWGILQMEAIP